METNNITKLFNLFSPKIKQPLTLEMAIMVFDHLADMEDIAFGYAVDGCYARAHIMCTRMIEAGLTPQKAWAFESEEKLTVGLDGRKVRWWFHVAPTLSVQMPDGALRNMVIDPSLFDGPVTLKEWGDIMKAEPGKLQVVAFDSAPAGYTGAYTPNDEIVQDTDKKAKEVMDAYINRQRSGPRKVFASQVRQQVTQQSQVQGKTWVSIAIPVIEITPEKKISDGGWGFDAN